MYRTEETETNVLLIATVVNTLQLKKISHGYFANYMEDKTFSTPEYFDII